MASIYNEVLDGVLVAYVSVIDPSALWLTRRKQAERFNAWLGRQFTMPSGAGLAAIATIVQKAIDCEGDAISIGKRTNALLHAHQALKALVHLQRIGKSIGTTVTAAQPTLTINQEISQIVDALR